MLQAFRTVLERNTPKLLMSTNIDNVAWLVAVIFVALTIAIFCCCFMCCKYCCCKMGNFYFFKDFSLFSFILSHFIVLFAKNQILLISEGITRH